MFGLYDIYRGTEKIGKAEVSREGLYYRFRCCCDLAGESIHRLMVRCGDKTENLGIPIPSGDTFWLSVRLPVSRFPAGEPAFYAIPKEQTSDTGLWVPVSPETPFPYIGSLQNAVTQIRQGQIGVLISEEAKPDSDPTP